MFKRAISFAIIFCLVFEQSGFAQVAPQMNIPAYLSGYLSPDRFRPVHLRSLSFDQTTNNFNLLLDKGDAKNLRSTQLEETTRKLFEYFQTGLTLPNSMFWVNLRPDDSANIIDPYVEKTDLGKVLLEADLQLKKDIAAFTSPDTKEGRAYWNKLYAKAESLFGQEDLSIPTVTRPWIVPGEIIMAQSDQGAYVYKATLKVMLEQDYLRDAPEYQFGDPRLSQLNEYSSEIIRKEIIPKLTREVNSAKRYAGLRQVYYSLILAQWFKQKSVIASPASEASGTKQSASFADKIDSRDLEGLTSKQQWSKQTYYQAYRRSFEKGEYNKEETIPSSQGLTIRKYFSGGIRTVIEPADIMVLPFKRVIGSTVTPYTVHLNTQTGMFTVKEDPTAVRSYNLHEDSAIAVRSPGVREDIKGKPATFKDGGIVENSHQIYLASGIGNSHEGLIDGYVLVYDPSKTIEWHIDQIETINKLKHKAPIGAFQSSRIVFYAPETNPSFNTIMRRADGVIASKGGIYSHTQGFANEQNIAAITDVGQIMINGRPIRTGDRVDMNPRGGMVYPGAFGPGPEAGQQGIDLMFEIEKTSGIDGMSDAANTLGLSDEKLTHLSRLAYVKDFSAELGILFSGLIGCLASLTVLYGFLDIWINTAVSLTAGFVIYASLYKAYNGKWARQYKSLKDVLKIRQQERAAKEREVNIGVADKADKKDGGLLSTRQKRLLLEEAKNRIGADTSLSLFQQREAMKSIEEAVRNDKDVAEELRENSVLSIAQKERASKMVKGIKDGGQLTKKEVRELIVNNVLQSQEDYIIDASNSFTLNIAAIILSATVLSAVIYLVVWNLAMWDLALRLANLQAQNTTVPIIIDASNAPSQLSAAASGIVIGTLAGFYAAEYVANAIAQIVGRARHWLDLQKELRKPVYYDSSLTELEIVEKAIDMRERDGGSAQSAAEHILDRAKFLIFASRAERLVDKLNNDDPQVRDQAIERLRSEYDAAALSEILTKFIKDDSNSEFGRLKAMYLLAEVNEVAAIDAIIPALNDFRSMDDFRRGKRVNSMARFGSLAAEVLVRIGTPAVERLIAELNNPNNYIRMQAAWALGKIADQRATVPLLDSLTGDYSLLKKNVITALAAIKDDRAIAPIKALLEDADYEVRQTAINALKEFKVFDEELELQNLINELLAGTSKAKFPVRYAEYYRLEAAQDLGEMGEAAVPVLNQLREFLVEEPLLVLLHRRTPMNNYYVRAVANPVRVALEQAVAKIEYALRQKYEPQSRSPLLLQSKEGVLLQGKRAWQDLQQEALANVSDPEIRRLVQEITTPEFKERFENNGVARMDPDPRLEAAVLIGFQGSKAEGVLQYLEKVIAMESLNDIDDNYGTEYIGHSNYTREALQESIESIKYAIRYRDARAVSAQDSFVLQVDRKVKDAMDDFLKNKDTRENWDNIKLVILKIGEPAENALIEMLKDPSQQKRRVAVDLLVRIGSGRAIEAVEEQFNDPDRSVSQMAISVLYFSLQKGKNVYAKAAYERYMKGPAGQNKDGGAEIKSLPVAFFSSDDWRTSQLQGERKARTSWILTGLFTVGFELYLIGSSIWFFMTYNPHVDVAVVSSVVWALVGGWLLTTTPATAPLPSELMNLISGQLGERYMPRYWTEANLEKYVTYKTKLKKEYMGLGVYRHEGYPHRLSPRNLTQEKIQAIKDTVANYFTASQQAVDSGWYKERYGAGVARLMAESLRLKKQYYHSALSAEYMPVNGGDWNDDDLETDLLGRDGGTQGLEKVKKHDGILENLLVSWYLFQLKTEDHNQQLFAIVRLGEIGNPRALQDLTYSLHAAEERVVRDTAARALGDMGDKSAVPDLIYSLRNEPEYSVRASVARSLGKLKDPSSVDFLLAALNDITLYVRRMAVEALGEIGGQKALDGLKVFQKDPLKGISGQQRFNPSQIWYYEPYQAQQLYDIVDSLNIAIYKLEASRDGGTDALRPKKRPHSPDAPVSVKETSARAIEEYRAKEPASESPSEKKAASETPVSIKAGPDEVMLNNGTKESIFWINVTMIRLKNIMITNYMHFFELVSKCHDPGYKLSPEAEKQFDKEWGLIDDDGTVYESTRNIILSAVKEDGDALTLISPIKDPRIIPTGVAYAVNRDGGKITAKEVAAQNLQMFNENDDWKRAYSNSKGSTIITDIGSASTKQGYIPELFGLVDVNGNILYISNTPEFVDAVSAGRNKDLYEFSAKDNMFIVDDRLAENGFKVVSILITTFELLDEQMAQSAGVRSKDGGAIDDAGRFGMLNDIKSAVEKKDMAKLEDLARQLMKKQSDIIAQFIIPDGSNSSGSGMSLSWQSAKTRIEMDKNDPVVGRLDSTISKDDAINALQGGKLIARIYYTHDKGSQTAEHLVLFYTAKGLMELFANNKNSLSKGKDGGVSGHMAVDEVFIVRNRIKPIATGLDSVGALHGFVVVVEPNQKIADYKKKIESLKAAVFSDDEKKKLAEMGLDPKAYSPRNALDIILYIQESNPEYNPLIGLSDGVILANGGRESHGYKFASGLGLPVVADVKKVMLNGQPLQTGDWLTVDANNGRIYEFPQDASKTIPLIENLLEVKQDVPSGRIPSFEQRYMEASVRMTGLNAKTANEAVNAQKKPQAVIPPELIVGKTVTFSLVLDKSSKAQSAKLSERFGAINNKEVVIAEISRKYSDMIVNANDKPYLLDWNRSGVFKLTDPVTSSTYVSGIVQDGGTMSGEMAENDLSIDWLSSELKERSLSRRILAVKSLKKIENSDSMKLMIQALKDESPTVRRIAATALGKSRNADAVGPLLSSLNAPAGDISDSRDFITAQLAAARALSMIRNENSVSGLIESLEKNHSDAAMTGIIYALLDTGSPRAYSALALKAYDVSLNPGMQIRMEKAVSSFKSQARKDGGMTLSDSPSLLIDAIFFRADEILKRDNSSSDKEEITKLAAAKIYEIGPEAYSVLKKRLDDGSIKEKHKSIAQEALNMLQSKNKAGNDGGELTVGEKLLKRAAVSSLYSEGLKNIQDYGLVYYYRNPEWVIRALEEILKLDKFSPPRDTEKAILEYVQAIVIQGPGLLAMKPIRNIVQWEPDRAPTQGQMILLAAQVLAKNSVKFTDELLEAMMPLLDITYDEGTDKSTTVSWKTTEFLISQGDEAQRFLRQKIESGQVKYDALLVVNEVLDKMQKERKDGGDLTGGEKLLQKAAVLSLYADRLKIRPINRRAVPGFSVYDLDEGSVIQALEEIGKLDKFSRHDDAEKAVIKDLQGIIRQAPLLLTGEPSNEIVMRGKMILLAARILAKHTGEFTDEILEAMMPLLDITYGEGFDKSTTVSWSTIELIISQGREAQRFLRQKIESGQVKYDALLIVNEVLEAKKKDKKDGGDDSLLDAVKQKLAQLKDQSASVGGIDLRALPIGRQPETASISMIVPGTDSVKRTVEELEATWTDIEKSIQSGPMPYEQLKAQAIACCQNKDAQAAREKLSSCIVNLLKLEEEAAVATAPELKEILIVLS